MSIPAINPTANPGSNPGLATIDSSAASGHVVTASDLVRHFGSWQDRAARAPVYILHRGRPRHVLTSVEVMQALCAPHDEQQQKAGPGAHDALLDLIGDIVLLCDSRLGINGISRAARSFFGADVRPGTMLDRLSTPATSPFLADAARRVLASGAPEIAEIEAARFPGRRLECHLAPYPNGVAILARDASAIDELAQLRAAGHAQAMAIGAVAGVATARINLRGYLDAPSPTLGILTGLSAEGLASVRFVTLMEIGSRVTLGDAIESVIASGDPQSIRASLLVNRGVPVAVRIGLAAIRRGVAVTGVSAAIAVDAAS
jgi:PAS domain-containing protein